MKKILYLCYIIKLAYDPTSAGWPAHLAVSTFNRKISDDKLWHEAIP